MLMNGQPWGKFYQTNTQTDQARPKKQQGRNLTGQTRPSKAASNGPIAGSFASQQSDLPKAQQDLLHGGPWTQPVEGKTAPARRSEDAARAAVRKTGL